MICKTSQIRNTIFIKSCFSFLKMDKKCNFHKFTFILSKKRSRLFASTIVDRSNTFVFRVLSYLQDIKAGVAFFMSTHQNNKQHDVANSCKSHCRTEQVDEIDRCWWSNDTFITFYNISDFVHFQLVISFDFNTKMSGRKTVGRKAKEKPPSKAKTSVQTRTRRAAKLTLNTSDFEADSNAIKDTTREKRSKKKSVESSTDIEESVLCTDKSQDNVKGNSFGTKTLKNTCQFFFWISVLERRNIRKRSNVNIAAQRQSIMSSEGLEKNEHSSTEQSSTEQSSSIVATTSRKRANKNSDFSYSDGDEEHVNIVDVDFDAPVSPKKKRAKKTASVPRKRKLRPEDQRTLQILMEKFKFTEHGASCEVPSCQSNLKTTRPANLKRHLAQVHPQLYANLFPHEMDSKKMAKLEAFNAVQDAIELVTVNGYPFSLLNASGMRGFVKSRVQPLRLDGEHIEINRLDIVKKVAEMSDIIRKRIQSELKGKTVSLMFDMCTIATLATFGVNVTYMENGKVVCRSLGVIKIEKRHTAVNLADMLFDMLAQYEIPLSKVFSITTDTAKNATNTSEVLNMVMENSNENPEDGDEDFIYDEEDQNELDFGLDHENVAELQKVINSAASHTALAEATASGIRQQNDSIRLINQINCGTHVLQLAINDALDETNATELISLVKKMCLLMRTQIVTIAIRQLGSKIILPPLDNATRWNSKYLMVSIQMKMKNAHKTEPN